MYVAVLCVFVCVWVGGMLPGCKRASHSLGFVIKESVSVCVCVCMRMCVSWWRRLSKILPTGPSFSPTSACRTSAGEHPVLPCLFSVLRLSCRSLLWSSLRARYRRSHHSLYYSLANGVFPRWCWHGGNVCNCVWAGVCGCTPSLLHVCVRVCVRASIPTEGCVPVCVSR